LTPLLPFSSVPYSKGFFLFDIVSLSDSGLFLCSLVSLACSFRHLPGNFVAPSLARTFSFGPKCVPSSAAGIFVPGTWFFVGVPPSPFFGYEP